MYWKELDEYFYYSIIYISSQYSRLLEHA
jgi:hypothetical protein